MAVRRKIPILLVSLTMVVVAATLLGCAKREPVQSSSSSSSSGSTTSAATREATAEATELVAEMKAEAGSGITGTADLIAATPGTKITVELKGLTAGDHVAYIYHGSCAGSGERHGPLSAFNISGDTATSTTNFVSLALSHFASESHFIVVQKGTSDAPGAAESCGEVKAAP